MPELCWAENSILTIFLLNSPGIFHPIWIPQERIRALILQNEEPHFLQAMISAWKIARNLETLR